MEDFRKDSKIAGFIDTASTEQVAGGTMNTLRLSTLSLILAVAVLALGYANPSLAAPSCIKNPDHPKCTGPDTTSDDTSSGGKHPSLILTFVDQNSSLTPLNIQSDAKMQSDGLFSYVHREGAAVSAGGQTQPNAAGIAFTPQHKAKNARHVNMDIKCVGINGGKCPELPDRLQAYFNDWPDLQGLFARCPTKKNCYGIHLKLRPYEVKCPPTPGDEPCPSIYTMSPGTPEQMSFRVGFGSGLLIEIASDIGGADSPNPGRCLSLMDDTDNARSNFIKACGSSGVDGINCNVKVEAEDFGSATMTGFMDGENDSWTVTAENATALICDRQSGTVLGKATMSFEFTAIKKD